MSQQGLWQLTSLARHPRASGVTATAAARMGHPVVRQTDRHSCSCFTSAAAHCCYQLYTTGPESCSSPAQNRYLPYSNMVLSCCPLLTDPITRGFDNSSMLNVLWDDITSAFQTASAHKLLSLLQILLRGVWAVVPFELFNVSAIVWAHWTDRFDGWRLTGCKPQQCGFVCCLYSQACCWWSYCEVTFIPNNTIGPLQGF